MPLSDVGVLSLGWAECFACIESSETGLNMRGWDSWDCAHGIVGGIGWRVSIEVSVVGALPDAPTTTTLSVSWLQSVFELSAAAESSWSATFGDSTGAEPFLLLLAGSIPGHGVQVIEMCTCVSRASADAPLKTSYQGRCTHAAGCHPKVTGSVP